MKFDLIITRHDALVSYLKENGYIDDNTAVIKHVTDPSILIDKNVCGVLPHSMSCLCKTFSEVPLNVPADMRGVELTLEDIYNMASDLVTYRVQKI